MHLNISTLLLSHSSHSLSGKMEMGDFGSGSIRFGKDFKTGQIRHNPKKLHKQQRSWPCYMVNILIVYCHFLFGMNKTSIVIFTNLKQKINVCNIGTQVFIQGFTLNQKIVYLGLHCIIASVVLEHSCQPKVSNFQHQVGCYQDVPGHQVSMKYLQSIDCSNRTYFT